MQEQTLIHADMFFFISSIGFVLITIALLVGLAYIISILHKVRSITTKIEAGVDTVGDDAKNLISDLRDSTAFRMIFGGRKHKKTTEK